MTEEQQALVDKLIEERWTYGRKRYNHMFMSYGPGSEWEGFLTKGEGKVIVEQDKLLSPLLGKEPLKGLN